MLWMRLRVTIRYKFISIHLLYIVSVEYSQVQNVLQRGIWISLCIIR